MKGMHKGIGCVGGLLIAAAVFCSGQAMAADKTKSRVTFYYLVAKELGKLGDL